MALDIERIKEELSQATVLELKQLIDALKEAWGVTAAARGGLGLGLGLGGAPGGAAPAAFAGCLSTGPCVNRTLRLDAARLVGAASASSAAAAAAQGAQDDALGAHDASLLWGETLVFPITLAEALQP